MPVKKMPKTRKKRRGGALPQAQRATMEEAVDPTRFKARSGTGLKKRKRVYSKKK